MTGTRAKREQDARQGRIVADVIHRPLEDDGGKDIAEYNKELEQRGNPSWLNVEWLFSECYLYRYFPLLHMMLLAFILLVFN